MIKSIICILSLSLFSSYVNATEAENDTDTSAYFIQGQTFPMPKATFGAGYQNHRLGEFVSRRWITGYRSLGIEYAYHFWGATKLGPYIKGFFERRWYGEIDRASIYDEQEKKWEDQGSIDNHTANHAGGVIGFQWTFGIPELYIQAGIGWQHNDSPVKLPPGTIIGLDQDTESRTEVAGEFGIGYLFYK